MRCWTLTLFKQRIKRTVHHGRRQTLDNIPNPSAQRRGFFASIITVILGKVDDGHDSQRRCRLLRVMLRRRTNRLGKRTVQSRDLRTRKWSLGASNDTQQDLRNVIDRAERRVNESTTVFEASNP